MDKPKPTIDELLEAWRGGEISQQKLLWALFEHGLDYDEIEGLTGIMRNIIRAEHSRWLKLKKRLEVKLPEAKPKHTRKAERVERSTVGVLAKHFENPAAVASEFIDLYRAVAKIGYTLLEAGLVKCPCGGVMAKTGKRNGSDVVKCKTFGRAYKWHPIEYMINPDERCLRVE